ncbi:helix-turn-helix domain-containing protein [Catenuloplanes atrovinosus]|uniref:Excisionase family DNA binding protein n=1 Tax=Catenuloplanes atrovinosus TaxID=137266 RepID=A0AAE3YS60_9ACTN|nr:helix-turn-helix domain-containing protein [Catenuloplanes atrovinosus]MDR7278899.1 excisionase family DNA binding protein [Catenuloplanes atrovinosus]
MTGRLLNIAELAEHLGVPRSWVRDKVTEHALPHRRVGRHVRFAPEDVAAIETSFFQPALTGPLAVTPLRTHPPSGPSNPPPPPGPRVPTRRRTAA